MSGSGLPQDLGVRYSPRSEYSAFAPGLTFQPYLQGNVGFPPWASKFFSVRTPLTDGWLGDYFLEGRMWQGGAPQF